MWDSSFPIFRSHTQFSTGFGKLVVRPVENWKPWKFGKIDSNPHRFRPHLGFIVSASPFRTLLLHGLVPPCADAPWLAALSVSVASALIFKAGNRRFVAGRRVTFSSLRSHPRRRRRRRRPPPPTPPTPTPPPPPRPQPIRAAGRK